MAEDYQLVPSIFEGWYAYQQALTQALRPLNPDQLELRAAPRLRSIGETAAHIIGARARWFYLVMGEGGDDFEEMGKWDRRGTRARTTKELNDGLELTWKCMQAAIARWTPEDWQQTWPGEGDDEPETLTRQWIIWHLIEHDLHHGGEISITLGAHGIPALAL